MASYRLVVNLENCRIIWHFNKPRKLFFQGVVLTALHTVKGVFTNLICSAEYFLVLKIWMSKSLWDQECLHTSECSSGFTLCYTPSFLSAICPSVCGKLFWIFWPAEVPGSKGNLLFQHLDGDAFLRQKPRTCMHVTTIAEIIFLLQSGSDM